MVGDYNYRHLESLHNPTKTMAYAYLLARQKHGKAGKALPF
jgi:hypothetical protein